MHAYALQVILKEVRLNKTSIINKYSSIEELKPSLLADISPKNLSISQYFSRSFLPVFRMQLALPWKFPPPYGQLCLTYRCQSDRRFPSSKDKTLFTRARGNIPVGSFSGLAENCRSASTQETSCVSFSFTSPSLLTARQKPDKSRTEVAFPSFCQVLSGRQGRRTSLLPMPQQALAIGS